MNKYDQYFKKYEEMGLVKPIYKDEKITVCNVGDYCYYVISNNVGVALNIKTDRVREVIQNPGPTFLRYNQLPEAVRNAVGFMVDMDGIDNFLRTVQRRVKEEPKISQIDYELEKQIMQEYGMSGRKM